MANQPNRPYEVVRRRAGLGRLLMGTLRRFSSHQAPREGDAV
jgi:hypothetical protein